MAPKMPDTMKTRLEKELLERMSQRRGARNIVSTTPPVEPSVTPYGSPEPVPEPVIKSSGKDRRLEDDVLRLAGKGLGIAEDRLDPTENLSNFGVDSIAITEVMLQISRFFAISVAPTTFFEAKHLDDLSAILRARYGDAIAAYYDQEEKQDTAASDTLTGEPQAWTVPQTWLKRHRAANLSVAEVNVPRATAPIAKADSCVRLTPQKQDRPAPIAIISMEGVFPHSVDLAAFEKHLQNGDDCIEEIPADRWDWRKVDGDPKKGAFSSVRHAGFVPDHDRFDAAFFNISPREAELMDPQHRLFMMCVWKLIENAGYAPGSLAGEKVGVFLGINLLDYVDMVTQAGIMDAQQMTGLGHAFCPNRLSFMLDIHGPSEVIDTACSSSLVAIHRAVMSIRHEGCEMAIAGGANLMLSPTQHILFSKVGMLAKDGRCKTFSADADGYGRADGVGAVLLKPLDRAVRDGDPIIGVISGSAEHHGGRGSSLTAPNSAAQARLIVDAHRQAGIDPRSIGYVECHGTGTSLGDPAEVEGLKLAFSQRYRDLGIETPTKPHIGLGSVKSNIGHAETAAGIAGLIKILLSMQSKTMFKTLHCADVNPLLQLENTPFFLTQEAQAWQAVDVDGVWMPRRACLNSFGAGGVNVHLVIEEYRPVSEPSRPDSSATGPLIIALSAKSAPALKEAVVKLRSHVAQEQDVSLVDVAYTLQVGRDAMRHRLAFVVSKTVQLTAQMDAFLEGKGDEVLQGVVKSGRAEDFNPVGADAMQIARRWIDGAIVDWHRLYPQHGPRRLALPSYAFQTKRYGLPINDGVAPIQNLLAPRHVDGGDAIGGVERFVLNLRGDEFFLSDHQVAGKPVLPGVAYLEMVRAAAAQLGIKMAVLCKVVWLKPLIVEAPVVLELELSRRNDGTWQAKVYRLGATGERVEHAQVQVREPVSTGEEVVVDLDQLQARHPQHHDGAQVYNVFSNMGLVYGPGHRVVEGLAIGIDDAGHRQVLTRLVLPQTLPQDQDTFGLHPSLLDGAFQAGVGMVLHDDGSAPTETALPFALESLEQLGPWEPRMWAHVFTASAQKGQSRVRKTDIDLIAEDGSVRFRLRGFAVRIAAVSTVPAAVQMFTPIWRSFEPDGPVDEGGWERHLFVADGTFDMQSLGNALEGWTLQSLTYDASVSLAKRYAMSAEALLTALQDLMHAPRLAPTLVQILLPDDLDLEPLAGLSGLIRSAGLEFPALRGQLIRANPKMPSADLAVQLNRAATAPAGSHLRVGGHGLCCEAWTLDELVISAQETWKWRDKGVYLITGGNGSVARLLTRYILGAAPQATIVLASRSGLGENAFEGLEAQDLERIEHVSVDVSDADSVADLIINIRRQHHHLHGVFHAAGVHDDCALSSKKPEGLARVLAPKVAGTEHLDTAIGGEPLDFMMLFSSLAGVLGNPGQTDYAAANGFLDKYALLREQRRKNGLCYGKTVSIAWPLWRDGGMQMDDASQAKLTRSTGLVPLETVDAMAALTHALAGDAPRCLVAAGDKDAVRRMVENGMTASKQSLNKIEAKATIQAGTNASEQGAGQGVKNRLLTALRQIVSDQLKVPVGELDAEVQLTEYGFDSISFTQLANALNDRFDLDIIPTLFFECPTLAELSSHFSKQYAEEIVAVLGGEVEAVPDVSDSTPLTATDPKPFGVVAPEQPNDAIAIIGMSGQFPQALNVEAFWQNLNAGQDAISEIPSERWDWRDYWGDPLKEPGRGNVKWGGFIDGVGAFDPEFFGISRPEARLIDPQQRLLLTQAWRLMESAGYAPSTLSGSDTGVFIGTADSGYNRIVADTIEDIEGHTMAGLAPSLGPNRMSYYYNLRGPSIAVETACSSALIAVHRAVEAIQAGRCSAAIAGGINLLISPQSFVGFAKAGMLSPEGRCKTFSVDADGYARGEGLGLVFLKRLEDAKRDGDRILALIRASGENHGGRASSLTAPNPKAQADLLRDVYRRAGFDPRTVSYIEAHGTGTPMGDPIEVEALKAAFDDLTRDAEDRLGPISEPMHCGIGSVKSNIGHLELASGIAGLIKVVLQMHHETLVKSLHCERLNPYMKLEGSHFDVVRQNQPWLRRKDDQGRNLPYRAGISCFGFGGSNAHVVVEEYVEPREVTQPEVNNTDPQVIVLSARTNHQLHEWADHLRTAVAGSQDALHDIAYTLQMSRDDMEHRLAFVCTTRHEMLARLEAFLAKEEHADIHVNQIKSNREAISILQSDEKLRQAAAGLAERGNFDALTALWVRGFSVDWADFPHTHPPRKVTLPGYPFATTSYWGKKIDEPSVIVKAAPVLSVSSDSVSVVADEEKTEKQALDLLVDVAAQVLEVDPSVLDVDAELGEYGFDSIVMTTFATQVNNAFELELSPADFFEFSTLNQLATYITETGSPVLKAPEPVCDPVTPPPVSQRNMEDDPVAIVGYSCHFPGARDVETFWDNLKAGTDSISRIPPDRWNWRDFDGDPKTAANKTNIHWGGFIDGVYDFEPLFFNISPREALFMDPQQRLLMMHVWNAIENAGHAPTALAGKKVGIFMGTAPSGYRQIIGENGGDQGYVATGSVASIGPNRMSYFLDFHGPSEPVETACSSSLVALHRAVNSIREGECEMALVGGINTMLTPEAHIHFSKAGMLSGDGRCKTFSSQADGYGRGEGVGVLFLKRRTAAECDGDPIRAIIRSSGVNHGGRANSLTAPNTVAQATLLREVYAAAGIDPQHIGYIETHGTGTGLGDPVEINALKSAFGVSSSQTDSQANDAVCAIGSVKTNIGHLELAAGVAGMIKVLLQLEHQTLVPSLHCDEINPHIHLDGTLFEIVRNVQPWAPVLDKEGRARPRLAGVSSFGFGGVNAHVLLEEYQLHHLDQRSHTDPNEAEIIVLSARDRQGLRRRVEDLCVALDAGRIDESELGNLAYTLQVGRTAMASRLALVVPSLVLLRNRLQIFLDGHFDSALFVAEVEESGTPENTAAVLSTDPSAIAAAWVKGGAIDFPRLHQKHQGAHRRLVLPAYPFARERYCFGSDNIAPSIDPTDHTNLMKQFLDANAFYLHDHRVRGQQMLPGSMSLELVRTAFVGKQVTTPITVQRVSWRRPLVLDIGRIRTVVDLDSTQDNVTTFSLRSGDEGNEHMRGVISLMAEGETAPQLDITQIRSGLPRSIDPQWLYQSYAYLGIDYGPAFRVIEGLWAGDGEVVARLRLPEIEAGGDSYGLHPSILDGAFQAALALFKTEKSGTVALPVGLDSLHLFAPTTPVMWARLRIQSEQPGLRKFDIDLADDTGRVQVVVRGFTLRELSQSLVEQSNTTVGSVPSAVERYFKALLAHLTDVPVEAIELTAPLERYGIDSLLINHLTDALEKDFGSLSTTLFFEHRTLGALIGYFMAEHGPALAVVTGKDGDGDEPLSSPSAQVKSVAAATAVETSQASNQPIAIIGLAGRYPGARSMADFWQNLAAGRDSITEIPIERWDHDELVDKASMINSRWGGFVDDFDHFDPLFFNISPSEAEYMDPQERLFMQCAWETLEDAGYTPSTLAPGRPPLDGGDVGVFVGVMWQEYQLYGAERLATGDMPLSLSGNSASVANRVSHFCNFHGPSMAVDSMCSSSLTAIHLACESLHSGSCRVALAGGVNLSLHPNKYIGLGQARFLSSTGRCESFGQGGDGYVPGEGVGAVLLKPLDQAIADGDQIQGVIRATALNHGGATNGYTVPNPNAQAAVIQRALDRAGVSPEQVSYVEAHGTGTTLGDPIEISALTKVYRHHAEKQNVCAIGSVKSNIGHGESAAGVAGLSKILLQFKHGQLAPSLHAETLNPNIDFKASPFVVQRSLEDWDRPQHGGETLPRIAGLSSFGAGGSNAHLILEEYVELPTFPSSPKPMLFPFSAHDADRLNVLLERFCTALHMMKPEDVEAAAHVLQQGREAFAQRLAVVAEGKNGLIKSLERVLAGELSPGVHKGRVRHDSAVLSPLSDNLDEVARAWVTGVRIDWSALWRGSVPRRLSLPTYPFVQDRYWLPEATRSVGVEDTLSAKAPLPLLFTPDWQAKEADVLRSDSDIGERDWLVLCELPDALNATLSATASPARVLVLKGDALSSIEDRFSDHAARLMLLLQECLKERTERIVVQVVISEASDGDLFAGLGGMLRTVSQEASSLHTQLLTLAGETSDDLVNRLKVDRQAAGQDGDIRYYAGQRLVRRWRELTVAETFDVVPWKNAGVYLIAGGTGGVGLHIAAEMAAAGRNPVLWLLGRSPLSAEKIAQLDRLPARIVYRQVDVADATALAAVVAEIRQKEGRLDGVIHAAGLIRDGLLHHKRPEDLQAVLAPKVAGVINLDTAIGDESLDFMLLFSSVAGALGNAGQSDYAAANAFLDGFASHRNRLVADGRCHGQTLSIDWPYWRDGGMHLDDAVIEMMERQTGVSPLEREAGLRALHVGMNFGNLDQLLVLDGDHVRLRRMMTPAVDPVPSSMKEAVSNVAEHPTTLGKRQRMQEQVFSAFAETLKIAPQSLDPDTVIDHFGVDSIYAVTIIERLEKALGPLPQTLLFEYPTINKLVDHLLISYSEGQGEADEAVGMKVVPMASTDQDQAGDVAVIAVAGRYPGADDIEALWQMLKEGHDSITEVPKDRWDADKIYTQRKGKTGFSHSKWGGFIKDVDRFDAPFFGYTPREADLTDPQVRLFLETTWHLLERAGHTRTALQQRYDGRVGVFVGAMYQQYNALNDDPDSQSLLLLSSYAAIANRTSFFFDLQGPSVAVDSMCSSGLQAVHQACQSLRSGECRLAVAGGVNLSIHPGKYIGLSRLGLIGSHKKSQPFAGDADGYLPAEGVGAVLLKPLEDAVRDKDNILAVIKGSTANHGGHSAGFSVPNIDAQVRLIEENLRHSGVDPRSIGYVESSANGSPVGDTIEQRALARVFRNFTKEQGGCVIGSVKSNIGHAEAASGLAQLTKILLQLERRTLLPSFRSQTAAEMAELSSRFADTPFVVQNEVRQWVSPLVDGCEQLRCATVSSFGAGGSNVHLIVQEAPERAVPDDLVSEKTCQHLFPLSARTPEQLKVVARQLEVFLRMNPNVSMARLSQTLRLGRERMTHHVALVAQNVDELLGRLLAVCDGRDDDMPSSVQIAGQDGAERLETPLLLPVYPFAREYHWIVPNEPQQPTFASKTPMESETPLLARLISIIAIEQGRALETIDPAFDLRALGVDSMIGMKLIYDIEEATGVLVGHRDFDQLASLQQLVEQVETRKANEGPTKKTDELVPPPGPWRCVLGEGQKGIWVAQELHPRSSVYNVPLAFRVKGIDQDVLTVACRWLLDRFPILSARLVNIDTDPVLVAEPVDEVLHRLRVPKVIDVLEFARRQVEHPFDMETEVKIRFVLLSGETLNQGENIFLIIAHHLVIDGVSMTVIGRELWQAYEALLTGNALPPVQHQQADYAHFVAWEHKFIASRRGKAELEYWRQQLSGELPVLKLPHDRQPPKGGLIDSRALEMRLSEKVTAAAAATAHRLGISRASFYIGVFSIFLYRYSTQKDLIIGVPTLRRPKRKFEETIGYCANMIALRLAVDGDLRTDDLLTKVHEQLMEGMDHAFYPFATIAREVSNTAQGEPPYQVSCAYQNFSQGPADVRHLSKGEVEYLPQLRQGGDGSFGLDLYEDETGLSVVAAYDGARFSPQAVNAMLGHFEALVVAVSAQSGRTVAAQPMLSGAEKKCLVRAWSGSSSTAPKRLIVEGFRRQARKTPDAIAIVAQDKSCSKTVTYRQLCRKVNRLARYLRQRGLQPGDRVGVLLRRKPSSIATLLAVLAADGVWVPLEVENPDQRLTLILKDAKVQFLVVRGAQSNRIAALGVKCKQIIDLKRDRKAIATSYARPCKRKKPVCGEDPAYIVYTSGSTGTPKGVVVSHGAIAEHCRVVIKHYGLRRKDVVLQFASHGVDTALEQILPTLVCGAQILLCDGMLLAPEDFYRLLYRHRVTIADLPPIYLRELLLCWSEFTMDQQPLVLRLCIVGGETLTPDLVDLWRKSMLSKARLLNAYGPTEATITALVYDVKHKNPKGVTNRVPIGRPLPGVKTYILDQDHNLVPEGVVGELHLGGRRLALGYHGKRKMTHQQFPSWVLDSQKGRQRLYRTGDLVSFVPGSRGLIVFHGRIDDQVQVRGFRVELGEVEVALMAYGGCKAVVLPISMEGGGTSIVAYVEPMIVNFDRQGLDDFLQARLPPQMVPSRIRFLDVLPLTPSGKVDRTALLELGGDPGQRVGTCLAPRDAVEQGLLNIWKTVLGDEGREDYVISVIDPFERCGGNSLSAVRLLREISQRFGLALSFAELGTASTIADQAHLVRQQLGKDVDQMMDASQPTNERTTPLLVPLRLVDSDIDARSPLFLVHPVVGSVTCYRDLVERLAPHRAVYGIQAAGIEAGEAIHTQGIVAMAQHYLTALKTVQAHGPYLLAGWSFGGLVAFEMARQLREEGEEISFLGLLDSYPPDILRQLEHTQSSPNDASHLAQVFARDLLGVEHFSPSPGEDMAEALLNTEQAVRLLQGVSPIQLGRIFKVFQANWEATLDYDPAPCVLPLTVIVAASEAGADLGKTWRDDVRGEMRVLTVPGDHYSFLQYPSIQTWVEDFSAQLERAGEAVKV